MNIIDRIFGRNKPELEDTKLVPTGGERIANFPAPGDDYGNFNLFGLSKLTYPTLGTGWKLDFLSRDSLRTEEASKLYRNIIQYIAPVSRAYNAWLRGILTEWNFVGTTPEMQAYIDNMLAVQERAGEPFDTVLEKALSYGYWSGGMLAEIALAELTGEFLRWKLANPFRVRFKEDDSDPEIGHRYIFGIHDPSLVSDDQFKSLEGIPTVLYQILNPAIDKPYAQPFIDPAISPTVIFYPMVMDMRRAYKGQAMPRVYFSWDSTFFRNMGWTPSQTSEFIKEQMQMAKPKLSNLKPEETGILPAGMIPVSDPGRMSKSAMDGVEMVRDMMMQMYSQALDVPASVLSSNEGVTETWSSVADRRWYKSLSSTQNKVESFFSILLTRAARAQGVSGEALFILKRNDELEVEREAEIKLKRAEANLKELEVVEKGRELGMIEDDRFEAISEEMFEEDISLVEELMESRNQLTNQQKLIIINKKKAKESKKYPQKNDKE